PDKEHHLIDQVSAPHYYAPEHASLAVHVFGGRMTYQIKTIGNWLLQIGRGEAIIYVENNMRVFFFEVPKPFQVDQFQSGIRGCLQEDHFGILLNGRFPLFRLCRIYIGMRNSPSPEKFGKKLMGGTKNSPARHNMVAADRKST